MAIVQLSQLASTGGPMYMYLPVYYVDHMHITSVIGMGNFSLSLNCRIYIGTRYERNCENNNNNNKTS